MCLRIYCSSLSLDAGFRQNYTGHHGSTGAMTLAQGDDIKTYEISEEDTQFILNLLRRGTTKWKGRSECLRLARKRVLVRTGAKGQSVFKWHWQCATCGKWTPDVNQMEVDHIVEVGPYAGDLHEYAKRLFCGQDNLQALCISCHSRKTAAYQSARSRWQRKA